MYVYCCFVRNAVRFVMFRLYSYSIGMSISPAIAPSGLPVDADILRYAICLVPQFLA